jgi:2-phosphosulfolactate phosphatase
VSSIDEALRLAARLTGPLLVGELGGVVPDGFNMNNSPAAIECRAEVDRPMILLSSSGTEVVCAADDGVYVACLRNYRAQAAHLAAHHPTVAVIGAGTRGEFREEDQLCCAWIAEALFRVGYQPQDARTAALVERWRGAPLDSIANSASAEYLRRSGQLKDLEFVMTHVNDLDEVYRVTQREVVRQAEHWFTGTKSKYSAGERSLTP